MESITRSPNMMLLCCDGAMEIEAELQNPFLFSFVSIYFYLYLYFCKETRLVYGCSSCCATAQETCEKLKGKKPQTWPKLTVRGEEDIDFGK